VKIVLERENRLAHFSSCMLANATNVWNVRGRKPLDRATRARRISFSPRELRSFIRHHEALHHYYLAHAVGTVVRLDYLQASRLEFRALYLALGLETLPLRPQTQKLYSDRMLDRYEHEYHDLIRQTLAELNKLEWLEERARVRTSIIEVRISGCQIRLVRRGRCHL
jgi:hypothetical protein